MISEDTRKQQMVLKRISFFVNLIVQYCNIPCFLFNIIVKVIMFELCFCLIILT